MGFIVSGGAPSLEAIQDLIGPTFTDTATIDFTYDDAGNVITADVKAPLLLASGSAGAPTYSFSSDVDNGFYLSATNEIGVAIGGFKGLHFAEKYVNVGHGGGLYFGPNATASAGYIRGRDAAGGQIQIGGPGGQIAFQLAAEEEVVLIHSTGMIMATSLSFDNNLYDIGKRESGTLERPRSIYVGTSILNANGSAAVPSYSFENDLNTGIYSPAADAIGLAVGGVARVVYDNTDGLHSAVDGSSNLGSATFKWSNLYVTNSVFAERMGRETDTDTYIQHPGNNTFRFEAGGQRAITVESSGASGVLAVGPHATPPSLRADSTAMRIRAGVTGGTIVSFEDPTTSDIIYINDTALTSTVKIACAATVDLSSNASLATGADLVRIGGYDIAAGQRTLALATEEAVGAAPAAADASLIVRINGVNYKIHLTAV